MADQNKKKYIKYEETTYILEDSRLPDPTGFDNKVLGVDNGAYVLKQEEGGGGGEGTVKSVNNIEPDANGNVNLSASDVHALPDNTVIPTVPQMATDPNMTDWTNGKTVDAAVLARDIEVVGRVLSAKYTKPASGIPASDLASGVIPDVSGKQDVPLVGQAYDSTAANYVTPYQVVTALEAGKDVIVEWHDNDFGTLYFTAWNTSHLGNVVAAVSNTAVTYNNSLILYQFAGNVASAGWYAVPSSVAQISDIPTVPTNVSAFTNDAGYLTQHQDISGKADKITVTASDNGKFMRVVNGAWAAVEVPDAESASFGGGSA